MLRYELISPKLIVSRTAYHFIAFLHAYQYCYLSHCRLWRKCFWDHSSNRAAPIAHICPCDGQHVRGNGNFLVPVRQLATLKTSFLVLRDARSFVGGCDLLLCRLFAIKSVYRS